MFSGIKSQKDKIAIFAPSSPFNKGILLDGVKKLKDLDFNITYSERIFERTWDDLQYFVGDPMSRAEEIMGYFKDPSVKAIVAARGGYGSNLVAEYLDYDVIKDNPKIFMGFSDLTFLLNAITQRAGFPTFHGPMVGTYRFLPMTKEDFNVFTDVLRTPEKDIEVKFEDGDFLNPQDVEGEIVGGNLTLLSSMAGTEYEIETDEKILFLEDINEAGYKIDRMLTHLEQSGRLDKVKAIIFGEMLACGTTKEILHNILKNLKISVPVITDFPAGHGERNVVIPVGGQCRVDAKNSKIILKGNA
jgi:muramoyltetrapeptide carboxypeptidase